LKANFCSTFKEEILTSGSDNSSEFKYDDGGADYDWSSIQYQYPDNLEVNFLDNLKNTEEDLENELSLPDVNISSLNVEQKFVPSGALKSFDLRDVGI
jgi:hypothetical protein